MGDHGINCVIRRTALRTRIRNEGVADISEAKPAGSFGALLSKAKTMPMTDLKQSTMAFNQTQFSNRESKNKPSA